MLERLIVLGGGGWFPAHGRQTACALLRDGESAVMIDAGTGVGRLIEQPDLLDGVQRLDILLTHFHLDHVSGLAYLPAVEGCEQITVWGPGRLLYDRDTEKLLGALSHEPFHPVPLEEQQIEVRDLPEQELELPAARVHLRRQNRHSAPTLGFRFDDLLAWVTDTAYEDESAEFAAGCRVLAHEAWFTEAHPRNADIHSSALEAARVSGEAGIDRLLLIHLPPFGGPLDELLLEAEAAVPRTLLADDGADMSPLLLGDLDVADAPPARSP